MLIPVAVRTLAEFVHRSGDLYPRLGGRVSPEEGIGAQRRAQRDRGEDYATELVVDETVEWRGLDFRISGRVDGCDLSLDPPLVEEIKTTRAQAADAERLVGSAHWAQLTLYAALLARTWPQIECWRLRLLYCHPNLDGGVPFERQASSAELSGYLEDTVARYGVWIARQMAYRARRDEWLAERPFPYGEFRRHQRALAGRVFRAFRDGEHLLLEAPTGSGKTMGVLFPALKALVTGHVERLFFLTSRGTGAIAALSACRDLEQRAQRIRVVDLAAKEKVCPVPGMPCDETCRYAVGYYDRRQGAVTALLDRGHMSVDVVRSVAEMHSVCPFELSLDAALWADVVIGDYNYLLDPVVRLQRFAEDGALGVLVDESHQLAERTRSMLSVALDRQAVRAALGELPPAPLGSRLKGVDRALLELHRSLTLDGEQLIDRPDRLLRAIERAMDALAEDEVDLNAYPATRELAFNLSRWRRSASWRDEVRFRYFAEVLDGGRGARRLTVSLVCLDPSVYLEERLAGYGPHVRFSGTVSPLALYQAQHGQTAGSAERLASLFEPDQLATLIVRDVPVYYRQRERTLPALIDLAAGMAVGHPGNYLLAVPSFEYLEQVRATFSARQPDIPLIAQVPGMDDAARAAFLADFACEGGRLGLIVLGGIFGESVDFSDTPLAGVICVGVGLPPVSVVREAMVAHFDESLGQGGGNAVAYLQPAMTKVLQMSGRLLRGPKDRGALCLVDDRFAQLAYRRFFPDHWRPEILTAAEIPARLDAFWQGEPGAAGTFSEGPSKEGPSKKGTASLDCAPTPSKPRDPVT